MACVKVIPIDGARPDFHPAGEMLHKVMGEKRKCEEQLQKHIESDSLVDGQRVRKFCELVWLEKYIQGSRRHPRLSHNPVDLLIANQIGNQRLQSASFHSEFATRHLVQRGLLQEHVYDLKNHNKVFCSQWLNDSQVILGTKCNTLMIIDLKTGKMVKIGCLKTSGVFTPDMTPCGIHAVETNPSGTLLATGAEKPNELAVYRIPAFDPICVGDGCHSDWIFDVKWLDDEYLVTGSRDSKLAMWKVDSDLDGCDASVTGHYYMKCLESVSCEREQKIRAIVFNEAEADIVALTLNAKVHVFDALTLKKKLTKPLPSNHENVCLAHSREKNIYSIGSKSNIYLLDASGVCLQTIESKHQQCGVRSISFAGDLLTIGTGAGGVLFYDVRMMNYLDDVRRDTYSCLSCSEGYVQHDDDYYDAFLSNMDYTPAIYTHRYDRTATRLFVAGGPLPANITGNYAALWS